MRKFQDLPIKRKLTWIIMLASVVALFLACAAFVSYEVLAQRRTMVRTLFSLADVIGANAYSSLLFNDQKTAGDILSSPHQERSDDLTICRLTGDALLALLALLALAASSRW